MSDLQCEIRSRPTAHGFELSGLVWCDSKVSGSFVFSAERQGASGSSHTVQRGLFDLEANQTQVLGSIGVNVTGGDEYAARLTITTSGLVTASDTILT